MGTAPEPALKVTTRIQENFDDKPFALGPDHIRRIVEIIQRRLIDVSFIFWARRIDGCLLETRTLEDLLGDVRLEDERIERFRLACREGTNSTDVEIIFSSDYASVRLEINSSQHDTAHLLASELRKYIGGTVLVNRISSGILAGTLFALALIMMVVAVLGSTPLFPAGQ